MLNFDGLYVLGDGDKIRERIEYYLLNHDTTSLSNFSQNLTIAINEIRDLAISTMSAHIILAGGDDILFYAPRENYQNEHLRSLQQTFLSKTGTTISFGVGKTIEAAYINLRKAKGSMNNKIVEEIMF